MTKTQWFVNLEGKTKRALTEEEMVHLINDGKLTKGSLVWRKGMSSWEPIEIHFDITSLANLTLFVDHEKANKLHEITPIQEAHFHKQNERLPQIGLLIPAITAICGVCLFLWVHDSSLQMSDPSISMGIWWAMLAASVLGLLFLDYRIWQFANTYQLLDRSQTRAGIVKLIAFFGGIGILIYLACYSYDGFISIKVGKARSAYNKYSVDVDVVSNTISISGIIGPELANRIRSALSIHNDI